MIISIGTENHLTKFKIRPHKKRRKGNFLNIGKDSFKKFVPVTKLNGEKTG